MGLLTFNRESSCVNGVEPQKLAAKTALNRKISCVSGIEMEKAAIKAFEPKE